MLSVRTAATEPRRLPDATTEVSGVHVLAAAAHAAPLLYAALGYALTLVALATLAPFQFLFDPTVDHAMGELTVQRRDVILNLAMLAPIGFLHRMGARRRGALGLDALVLGATISAVIETTQFFVPSRSPSVVDLVCNATGAWAGAHLCHLLKPWLSRTLAAHLSRNTPLGHVIPLLSVVIGLASLLSWRSRLVWVCLPLGLAGAVVLAAGQRQRAPGLGAPALLQLSLRAAGWMAASMIPAFMASPIGTGLCVAAVGAAAYWAARAGLPQPDGRRFEEPTMRWVLGATIVYALLTAVLPALCSRGQGGLALAGPKIDPLALLERVAVLTVVGYIAASAVGRRLRRDALPVAVGMLSAGLMAAPLELARLLATGHSSGWAAVWTAAVGGLWGGTLYCTRRQAAIARRADATACLTVAPG